MKLRPQNELTNLKNNRICERLCIETKEKQTEKQLERKKEERNREYNQNDKASDSYYVRQLTIINVTNRSNYHEIIVNVIEVDVCDQTTKKTSQKLYSVTKLFYKPFFHFCKVSLFLP